ncbi:PREDICTED: F-box only protein 4-like [Priapulus caudatus]|uniref:F-box only protein 4-like n=1 Tax=Priapulus caudatus TaxID=37621 RepID=A0ABM1EBH9_PRICU|nr:PREDICTED: F-box only protein 4-like [Priapulus caudatus]
MLQLSKQHQACAAVDCDLTCHTGGLQQYINKLVQRKSPVSNTSGNLCDDSNGSISDFLGLPVSVQLQIFSYLSPKALCGVASVCRQYYILSCDEILWQRHLYKDVVTWNVLTNELNPDDKTDLPAKQIYQTCSQQFQHKNLEYYPVIRQISTIIKTLISWRPPKVVMFGPGLESSATKCVLGKMLYDTSLFQITGLVPGRSGGIGAGIDLRIKSRRFTLITLYSNTERVREQYPTKNCVANNRMLAQDGDGTIYLTSAMGEVARSANAFVFVVDASDRNEYALRNSSYDSLLSAVVTPQTGSSCAPLLVVAAAINNAPNSVSAIEVTRNLKLNKILNPWQVHMVDIANLGGISAAFEWVLEQAH